MNDLKELTKIEDTLESLIDAHGLAHILESIEIICYGKAEHLRSNWQDEASAKIWDCAGRKISRAASKIDL